MHGLRANKPTGVGMYEGRVCSSFAAPTFFLLDETGAAQLSLLHLAPLSLDQTMMHGSTSELDCDVEVMMIKLLLHVSETSPSKKKPKAVFYLFCPPGQKPHA